MLTITQMKLFESVRAEAATLQLQSLLKEAISSIKKINDTKAKAISEVLVDTENTFATLALTGTDISGATGSAVTGEQ